MKDTNTTIPKKGTYEYLDWVTKQHDKATAPKKKVKKQSGLGMSNIQPKPKMSASEQMLADFEKKDIGRKMKKNGTNTVY